MTQDPTEGYVFSDDDEDVTEPVRRSRGHLMYGYSHCDGKHFLKFNFDDRQRQK